MYGNIDRIKSELDAMGYETATSESPQGTVVSFEYVVETGSYKDRQVRLGLSFQGDEPYPEYPPHWIHLTPPVDDGKGGAVQRYIDDRQREWVALSRPPAEIWDRLPTKHMGAYMDEHLRRFWNSI